MWKRYTAMATTMYVVEKWEFGDAQERQVWIVYFLKHDRWHGVEAETNE